METVGWALLLVDVSIGRRSTSHGSASARGARRSKNLLQSNCRKSIRLQRQYIYYLTENDVGYFSN
jgi:hypothetical protein